MYLVSEKYLSYLNIDSFSTRVVHVEYPFNLVPLTGKLNFHLTLLKTETVYSHF